MSEAPEWMRLLLAVAVGVFIGWFIRNPRGRA